MYQILVAEDEPIERKALCKKLREHLGERCQVLEAKNGREAVEFFGQHRPQVAILDIEMPGLHTRESDQLIFHLRASFLSAIFTICMNVSRFPL